MPTIDHGKSYRRLNAELARLTAQPQIPQIRFKTRA